VAQGDSGEQIAQIVARHVLDVPGFPKDGIVFKDLSPLFADGAAFRSVTDAIVGHYAQVAQPSGGLGAPGGFDIVAGIEARGFLVAAAVAYAAGVGVVAVRKAGKLPRATHAATYDLEYGSATLEVHADAFLAGQRVLVVDDVLATGGTAAATLGLVERAGGVVAGLTVLLELSFLSGRQRLAGRAVHALLTV
jgi:adenine phosphoribosyltransferase